MSDTPIQQKTRLIITPQMRGAVLAPVRPGRPEPYKHRPYPATRYHEDGSSVTVQNAEEDAALGPEYAKFPPPPPPAPAAPPKELTGEEWKAKYADLQREMQRELRALENYGAEKVAEILELQKELAAEKLRSKEAAAQIEDLRAELLAAAKPEQPATAEGDTAEAAATPRKRQK
jgi:hypothetical protein